MFFTLVETGSALKPWRLWKNEKMTLWVVEATTESSEKMKSKRAVRWHDLDKGNMDRSKNRFCSASILKRRVVKQMSIFLVQPGNTWQWRQKPWTTKKMRPGKTAKLHKVARNQKTWRKSFLNNHLSPNFKNFQEMLDYTPEVHRMSGKDRARESARNWFLQSSNKTDGKAAETILLKPF